MIITFCGHSDYHTDEADKARLLSFLEEHVGDQAADFYLGGCGAFDSLARDCAKDFQKTHPKTKLILVTAYINRTPRSNEYDETIYPHLENTLPKFAISRRNKWMIEKADLVIAYINHSFGGAFQSYIHAKKKKKPVFNLTGLDF